MQACQRMHWQSLMFDGPCGGLCRALVSQTSYRGVFAPECGVVHERGDPPMISNVINRRDFSLRIATLLTGLGIAKTGVASWGGTSSLCRTNELSRRGARDTGRPECIPSPGSN